MLSSTSVRHIEWATAALSIATDLTHLWQIDSDGEHGRQGHRKGSGPLHCTAKQVHEIPRPLALGKDVFPFQSESWFASRNIFIESDRFIKLDPVESSIVDTAASVGSSLSKANSSSSSSVGSLSKQSIVPIIEKSSIGSVTLSTCFNSENPYRRATNRRSVVDGTVSHSRSVPHPLRPSDPLQYKDEMFIKPAGDYSVCVKPEIKLGGTPSRSEVTSTLVKLTRKNILCFNARIVETGAALRVTGDLSPSPSPPSADYDDDDMMFHRR